MNGVVEVEYAGMALDLDATYTLATNNYVGSGGDGFDVFVDKKRLIDANAGTLMATQVIEYIASQGSVAPMVEGRLRTVQ